jgi:hypothetical protein
MEHGRRLIPMSAEVPVSLSVLRAWWQQHVATVTGMVVTGER